SHAAQVHSDGRRQVGWQAGDFQLGQDVADNLAAQLDGWGHIATFKVQRNFGGDGLRSQNALEVNVQNLLLVRVPLNRAQQHFFSFTVQFHRQDGSVEGFFAQVVVSLVMIQRDHDGLFFATVNNSRNSASVTQAAARTRTLYITRRSGEFHGKLQFAGSWTTAKKR